MLLAFVTSETKADNVCPMRISTLREESIAYECRKAIKWIASFRASYYVAAQLAPCLLQK